MIALRMSRDLPLERLDLTLNELLRRQPVAWHGVKPDAPDWSDGSHSLAATIRLIGYPLVLHLIVNAYWEALDFELPALDAQASWRRCVDTFRDPPDDVCRWPDAPTLAGPTCRAEPRSIVMLLASVGSESDISALPK